MIQRALFMVLALATSAVADEPIRQPVTNFTATDVFNLEFADDPQISPNGRMVAYVRVSADIMTDRFHRSIWLVDTDERNHRPLAQGPEHYRSPVWSPSGDALAYLADAANGGELRVFDIATARSRVVARLPSGVANLTWSPDGRTLAYQALARKSGRKPASLPPQPKGATWSPPARVIEDVVFRRDGDGYLRAGYSRYS